MSSWTGGGSGYAIHFRTITAGSGWNNESLVVCFQRGLSEALKDELVTQEPSNDLEALIDLAVRLDNRLRERRLVTSLCLHPLSVQFPQSCYHCPKVHQNLCSWVVLGSRHQNETAQIAWTFPFCLPRALGNPRGKNA